MNEQLLFGFGILLFLFVWNKMIRRTVLDHHRDKLFDLREKVRSFYASREHGLADKTYINLRVLVNNQIRFLDTVSIYRLSLIDRQIKTNSELRQCINEMLTEKFATENKEIAEFIQKARKEAYYTVLSYVIFSSVFASLLFLSLFPATILALILRDSIRSITKSVNILARALMWLSRKIARSEVVEGYSSLPELESYAHSHTCPAAA
ncbi:MAG: hypothetical protein QM715_18570 [Nibricoccus sp.]